MSEEEKKAIERQFEMALDTIISKIKGETATAIVHSEQPMILLFKKLVYTIENQQKEIEELKMKLEVEKIDNKYNQEEACEEMIPRYKIRAKIEELEKEQENNRKSLYNAINILYFKEIDKISNRISVNMAVRDILQSLLEEE